MTITLESDFEDKLRAAALSDAVVVLSEDDGLVDQAIAKSEERLRKWSDEYDVEPVLETLEGPSTEIDPTTGTITVTWGWAHPAAGFFEFGTSEHVVEGDPILSFVWENPPQWVKEEFEPEGDGYRVFLPEVEVSGVDETRYGREGLRWLRNQMRSPTGVT